MILSYHISYDHHIWPYYKRILLKKNGCKSEINSKKWFYDQTSFQNDLMTKFYSKNNLMIEFQFQSDLMIEYHSKWLDGRIPTETWFDDCL